jgi:voltage-gated potassium channel
MKREAGPGFQLFMFALCIYALGVVAAESVLELNPHTETILQISDYGVCAVFFADFLFSLWHADNRWRYFITWGWIDLVSSIPAIDVARWGRVLRILRLFRALRAARMLTHMVARQRAQNTVLAAFLVVLMLITFSAIAILHFERVPQANIVTAEDALWWVFATVTTVGYGDRYPITTEGRMVAVALMVGGIALFGTLSAYLAAWFIGSGADDSSEKELAALRVEIAALRALIERQQNR